MEHYHDHSEEGDAACGTVALSEHTATRLAYRQYLGLLAEDDRGFRQAFRTAFFRAMREQLTPRHVRGAVDDRGGGIILQTVR